jgi:hypothetical protein
MPQQIGMFFPNRSTRQSVRRPVLRAQNQNQNPNPIKTQMSNNLHTRMSVMGNLSGTFHSKNGPCG